MALPLPPEHIALQLDFAHRVATVTGEPFDDVLRVYTTCYTATGLRLTKGLTSDPDAPEWHEFLRGFRAAPDPVAYVHAAASAVWEKRRTERPPRTACFGYRYDDAARTIHMQFAANDPHGPLAAARIPVRLAELRAMVAEIDRDHPEAERVHGQSWLYNLEAYRRLFPPAFVAQPRPVPGEYCVISSWGPFLDHRGGMKPDVEAAFRARIAVATSLDALLDAFPYPVLAVECDMSHFSAHYGDMPPTGTEG